MIQQLETNSQPEIIYPDSDGQPMANNTRHFRWIVTIKENLELLFASIDNVFIAGDLFWYPIEGDNKTRLAPDVMVVFGRPKGYRGSYRQWEEENVAPQVIFEIISPGNRLQELVRKFKFYERYGVEEYYVYEPDRLDLMGWLRSREQLAEIDQMDGWVSPRMGVRFDLSAGELQIFTPAGNRFFTHLELAQQKEEQRQRAERAEDRIKVLEARLREAGVNPEKL